MKLFIIGKIQENNKIVAYKVYDVTDKKAGIYSKKDVDTIVSRGVTVVGLHRTVTGRIAQTLDTYSIARVDTLDGKGNPIEETGVYALISLVGFADDRHYRLVNSKGEERLASVNEFSDLVDQVKINGARKNGKRITLNEHCNGREYKL